MFTRVKQSGKNQYLQIVESRREGKKVRQHVIATIGRLDQLNAKGNIESLVRSLSKFSEQALLILSGKSKVDAGRRIIGPALVFDRLWKQIGIAKALCSVLKKRKYSFEKETNFFCF